jgi:Cytochrome oxidase complex assembly protein 1
MSNADMNRAGIVEPEIPPEIRGWNWGAFLLNWIWGIGNNTYIALLALVPIVGVIMIFVLGAKGNRWAWRNGRWDSVAHFKRVQRAWAIAGFAVVFGMVILGGAIFGGVFALLKNSEAYQLAVTRLQASPMAANVLGAPISAGTPFGSIKISGETGTAELNFSVTGSKAKGTVYVDAVKEGIWKIRRLTLKVDGSDRVIDLITGANAT